MSAQQAPVDIYVYYRLRAGAAADYVATQARLRAMQKKLRTATGIAGTLARRRDDTCTWMEIYPAVNDVPAFERALAHTCREFELDRLIEPGTSRHIERFIPCV